MTLMTDLLKDRCEARFVLPSAIACFFHVYEERIGTYGLRVQRHVLVKPKQDQHAMTTGCDQVVGPHAYVTIEYDGIAVDRTWCRACAAVVEERSRRGHAPTSHEAHP